MQNPHNELPSHAADNKKKAKDEKAHENPSNLHKIHQPPIEKNKELLEKMRHIKPKE